MYKLLLLDIDGTLRDEVRGIPESARQAIHLCQKNNCKVIICTGRSMGTIQNDVLSLGVDGFIVGGGNCVLYKNNELFHQSFDQKLMNQAIALLKSKDVAFSIESSDKVFMNQKAKEIFDEMNKAKLRHSSTSKQFISKKIIYKNNIDEYRNQKIHKICLWAEEELFKKMKALLRNTMQLAQSDPEHHYYEIIQSGCDKGKAIKRLQNYLNISRDETISFGDGQNDIAMADASHTVIAMKRSHQMLKEKATSICEDIFDDGIYKELKRRGII